MKSNTCLLLVYAFAKRISEYADDSFVYHVHNASHNKFFDLLDCAAGFIRASSPPVNLLVNLWKELDKLHPPHVKFFHVCHSQGSLETRNSLEFLPKSIRERIIVLAIAPATIIPKKMCHRSFNYATRLDIVPYIDLYNRIRYRKQITILKSHSSVSPWMDHSFNSPTYDKPIKDRLTEYLQNYGDN